VISVRDGKEALRWTPRALAMSESLIRPEHVSYIPAEDFTKAEITVKSLVLGVVLSVILAAQNVYAGLLAGITNSASIPASVISMAVLRLFKERSILENNLVQTCASAGESLAAGVIFTLPAMSIFYNSEPRVEGGWENYLGTRYVEATVCSLFGGLLGVLFSIPIRRALIADSTLEPPLAFPEGVATANVLIQGNESETSEGIVYLAKGALLGAGFKFINTGLEAISTVVRVGGWFGFSPVLFDIGVEPITLGIGYIVGWRVGIVVLLGSMVQFVVGIPFAAVVEGKDFVVQTEPTVITIGDRADFGQASFALWGQYARYMGVGSMLIGSIWCLISIRQSLIVGVMTGIEAFQNQLRGTDNRKRTEKDLPMGYILAAIAGSVFPIYILFSFFTDAWGKSIVLAVFVVILGFVFSAVASYMAGLVGSSNNPVSGVTISTVLIISLIIRGMFGRESEVGAPAAVLVGNIVCSAAAIGGDNMQDLKAGHILGSTPWKQQIMQIVGVSASALVMAPTLEVLRVAYGFGDEEGQLPAPQAQLVASVSDGVISGGLPWSYLGVGILIGAFVIALDLWLESKESSLRVPILAFAVGFYLPMDVGSAIFVGSLVPWFLGIEDTEAASPGLMYSAGVITGAGLMGIIIAFVIVFYGLIADPDSDDSNPLQVWTGLDASTNTVLSICQLGILLGGMLHFSSIDDPSFKKHDEDQYDYKAAQ